MIRYFLAMFLTLAALQAQGDSIDDCSQEEDISRLIEGCTAIIRSGDHQRDVLANAYYNRGVGYQALGDHRRALQDFDNALRIDPADVDTHINRGNTYRRLGKLARAIQDYTKSLLLEPDSTDALMNRAGVHLKMGNIALAEQDVEAVLKLAPLDHTKHKWAAYYYLKTGNMARALDAARTANLLAPEDKNILALLGYALCLNCDQDKAIEILTVFFAHDEKTGAAGQERPAGTANDTVPQAEIIRWVERKCAGVL